MDDVRNHGGRGAAAGWTPRGPAPATGGGPAARNERHVLLGVSHPSNDPARHRVFQVRASFDESVGGWVAHVGEEDRNEQLGTWTEESGGVLIAPPFPDPATCIGDAVRRVIDAVDRDAVLP